MTLYKDTVDGSIDDPVVLLVVIWVPRVSGLPLELSQRVNHRFKIFGLKEDDTFD